MVNEVKLPFPYYYYFYQLRDTKNLLFSETSFVIRLKMYLEWTMYYLRDKGDN